MTWPRPRPVVGDATSAAERREDPSAWRFSDAERSALYDVIAARRDIRRFRPDPISEELLQRVLFAAHSAPSVGHSQPWRFILVTDESTRERAAAFADRERLRQADHLSEEAARRLLDLQLEGIREAPLGLVVACDRRTEPSGVLGRATFHDADLWSCACAIENLWLAARAEGLGVGWVTLFRPPDLADLVNLPAGVETLGWLCVGWPDERPPTPGLERLGWSRRLALDSVVVRERWEGEGPDRPPSHIRPPGQSAVVGARDAGDELLTPPGSLGLLDRVIDRLTTLGTSRLGTPTLVLVGADHPVAKYAVSTYDAGVTHEVLDASLAGESLGAAAAKAVGLDLVVVDAGVDGPLILGAHSCRPRDHRGDLVNEDALSESDITRLLELGRSIGRDTTGSIVAIGEFGIANTTVAAALASALLGLAPHDTVGLGAGGDSPTMERKLSTVQRACSRAVERYGAEALRNPLTALRALGGGEFTVLCGVILGAASRGGAVVLDGYATSISALCARRLDPGVGPHLIAGQRSRERGHAAVLEELGLEPLLDLRIRSGEGVGAVLATQLIITGVTARALAGRVDDAPTIH